MITIEDVQTLGQAPVVDQAVIEAVAREEYKIAQASPATKEEVMEDAVIWLESLLVDFWQPDNQAYLRQYIDRWKAVLVPSAYEPGPELEPEWAKLPWAEPPVYPATTMPVYDVPTKPAVPVIMPVELRPAPIRRLLPGLQLLRFWPIAIGVGAVGIGGTILWLVLRRR